MLKKKVEYVDFNGEDVKEELYFNLNVVEQTKFESKYIGGKIETLEQYLKLLLDNKDAKEMINFICDLIESSYGEKSEDGKVFNKSKEIRTRFENSLAYSEIFEELFSEPSKLEDFANGILSKNKSKQVASDNVVQ